MRLERKPMTGGLMAVTTVNNRKVVLPGTVQENYGSQFKITH
jgi:hypothetical protein